MLNVVDRLNRVYGMVDVVFKSKDGKPMFEWVTEELADIIEAVKPNPFDASEPAEKENPAEKPKPWLKQGDYFIFKTYKWIALEVYEDSVLAVTAEDTGEDIIFAEDGSNKWYQSDARRCLNDWAKREIGKDNLLEMSVATQDEAYETYGDCNSLDYARLLDLEEWLRYKRLGCAPKIGSWSFLRSAYRGYAGYVWVVNSSGYVTTSSAYNGHRLCPVCTIKRDAVERI